MSAGDRDNLSPLSIQITSAVLSRDTFEKHAVNKIVIYFRFQKNHIIFHIIRNLLYLFLKNKIKFLFWNLFNTTMSTANRAFISPNKNA